MYPVAPSGLLFIAVSERVFTDPIGNSWPSDLLRHPCHVLLDIDVVLTLNVRKQKGQRIWLRFPNNI